MQNHMTGVVIHRLEDWDMPGKYSFMLEDWDTHMVSGF